MCSRLDRQATFTAHICMLIVTEPKYRYAKLNYEKNASLTLVERW